MTSWLTCAIHSQWEEPQKELEVKEPLRISNIFAQEVFLQRLEICPCRVRKAGARALEGPGSLLFWVFMYVSSSKSGSSVKSGLSQRFGACMAKKICLAKGVPLGIRVGANSAFLVSVTKTSVELTCFLNFLLVLVNLVENYFTWKLLTDCTQSRQKKQWKDREKGILLALINSWGTEPQWI